MNEFVENAHHTPTSFIQWVEEDGGLKSTEARYARVPVVGDFVEVTFGGVTSLHKVLSVTLKEDGSSFIRIWRAPHG